MNRNGITKHISWQPLWYWFADHSSGWCRAGAAFSQSGSCGIDDLYEIRLVLLYFMDMQFEADPMV